jgi:hypothetical protein
VPSPGDTLILLNFTTGGNLSQRRRYNASLKECRSA